MDFWKSALAAAEKAAEAAKDLGKKGLEVVESTAEEASKKLNLNMYDKVGAGGSAAAPPSEELAAYGVTPEFAEFVRTLNYSTFRDFPADHLLPAGGEGSGGSAAAGTAAPGGLDYRLNPWQVRHATLVVQALKEVNELRFVLCPKYMTDEHFWHVYFTLARKHLPDAAFSWAPGQALPFADKAAAGAGGSADAFSLTDLSDQLRRLGSKIQSATSAGAQRGLEFTTSLTRGAAAGASASAASAEASAAATAAAGGAGGGSAPAAGAAGLADAAAGGGPVSSLLEEDPDLEAYLQVAINSSGGGSGGDDEGSGGFDAVGDEDLDLDSYINELSAEVEAAAAGEDGGDGAAEPAAAAAGDGQEEVAPKQD